MYQHGPTCLKGPVWRNRFQNLTTATSDPSTADIRWELVDRVRREIAQGDYDTPEKWEAALDRLLDRLEAQ